MHKINFITYLGFVLLFLTPLNSQCQNLQDCIFGKKWYAIKEFGVLGESYTNEFVCENGCSLESNPYLFYLDIDRRSGRIKTDKKFKYQYPFRFSVKLSESKLIMYFSGERTDPIEFEVMYVSDDFLHLKGPDFDEYFLISDNKRT
ncbi:hypothetical protein [Niastella sp. OAS944]|uniref:hypothetical protein n=1 Tax=Niastella sp. OAS944 TaxID=2664089 RepID=UPI00347E04A2|nr:hypothetical protein [Chitinophagaceae bacterium OAS944]